MRRDLGLLGAAASVVALLPVAAAADTISFKLLPRYSYATFKTDAPIETVVGHTADTGMQGELSVDPAQPHAAKGTVKVDMNVVRTGIDKRDADMRTKPYLETEVEANRWVTFQVTGAEIQGPLEPGKAVPARIRGLLTVKQSRWSALPRARSPTSSCRRSRWKRRSASASPRTTSRSAPSSPRRSPITACRYRSC
jgi:polyisoprenoid-binding protein YceI